MSLARLRDDTPLRDDRPRPRLVPVEDKPPTRSRGSIGDCSCLIWWARFAIWATRNS